MHAPIALAVPGIDRYVQNLVVAAIEGRDVTDGPTAFDGFSECWFVDRPAYDRAMATPEWARLVEDGPNLLDMEALEQGMSVIVEERVIMPAPS